MAKRLHDEGGGPAGPINAESLERYVDRIEEKHIARDEISADIRAIYDEAKSAGFVTAIMRQIVKERRMEADERHDHYALLDSYRSALGMLADTPLGAAAMERAEERWPRPFAEQPVTPGKRRPGRPRKAAPAPRGPAALSQARAHLGDGARDDGDDLPPVA